MTPESRQSLSFFSNVKTRVFNHEGTPGAQLVNTIPTHQFLHVPIGVSQFFGSSDVHPMFIPIDGVVLGGLGGKISMQGSRRMSRRLDAETVIRWLQG